MLLCTELGGEGRNIQFCNTLINFDLPWNPMAIEQRVGRIDRIGQNREVFVFNLVTRGTLEDELLTLLDEKIVMFELVVGEVGAILGGLEEERKFPDLVLEAWLEASEAGRSEAFDALGRRLGAARSRHEDAKAPVRQAPGPSPRSLQQKSSAHPSVSRPARGSSELRRNFWGRWASGRLAPDGTCFWVKSFTWPGAHSWTAGPFRIAPARA